MVTFIMCDLLMNTLRQYFLSCLLAEVRQLCLLAKLWQQLKRRVAMMNIGYP